MRYLVFLTLWMLFDPLPALARTPAKPEEQGSPEKPAVAVSFERQAIRENDSVEVHVWLANEWEHDLSSVVLHIDAPASLKWNAIPCEEWEKNSYRGELANRMLDLGVFHAHEVRTSRLCVKSQPDIVVGDFNILFTVDYAWQQNNVTRHSFVTSEKTLKANLFGSDTVAGVPLALAGFIVPGLFFWLVVSWFDLPWGLKDLALGEKLLFSILVSFPIVYFVNKFQFPDVNTGVSLLKLLIYAVTGAITGLVIGGGHKLVRWLRQRAADERARLAQVKAEEQARSAQEKQVKFSDSEEALLGKLLNQYPDYRRPGATVRLVGGTEYIGSLAAESDEATALVGWFQIDKETVEGANREEIIRELSQAQRSLDLFNLARRYGVTIGLRNPIKERKNGVEKNDDRWSAKWTNEEAEAHEVLPDQSEDEPLMLV